MIGALVYLQLTSLKNSLKARVQRLRNPRYLFAALVGVAYFYFFLFRSNGHKPVPMPGPAMPATAVVGPALLEVFGGCALFVAIVLVWILPKGRAALAF